MINRLKQLRKSIGYSQSELAYMCDITRETIIRIENNRCIPTCRLLLKLEEIFGCWVYRLDSNELGDVHQKKYAIYNNHFPDECL